MSKTKIDWSDYCYNPIWGCNNSCNFCYARKFAKRFGRAVAKQNNLSEEETQNLIHFKPTFLQKNFSKPFPKKPSRIFINSMSDFTNWQESWIDDVFEKISNHPEHTFILLTKNYHWYYEFFFPYPELHTRNILRGVSAIHQTIIDAIPEYHIEFKKYLDGYIDFLSIEPIAGPIKLTKPYRKLRWIVVGAETGNRKDKLIPKTEWLLEIFEFAKKYNIPLFLKNNLANYWPGELIQEFPKNEVPQ